MQQYTSVQPITQSNAFAVKSRTGLISGAGARCASIRERWVDAPIEFEQPFIYSGGVNMVVASHTTVVTAVVISADFAKTTASFP